MAFNRPMYRQERLSKEEIALLLKALSEYRSIYVSDQVKFLEQKLERMEKGRK